MTLVGMLAFSSPALGILPQRLGEELFATSRVGGESRRLGRAIASDDELCPVGFIPKSETRECTGPSGYTCTSGDGPKCCDGRWRATPDCVDCDHTRLKKTADQIYLKHGSCDVGPAGPKPTLDDEEADCYWEKTANSSFEYMFRREMSRGDVKTSTAKECKALCEALEWCKLIEFSREKKIMSHWTNCDLYDLHTKDGGAVVPDDSYDLYELYCPKRDREAKTIYPTLDDEDLDDEEGVQFKLQPGATCAAGYEPLTSSWEACRDAAASLGFSGDSIAHVDYRFPWGQNRPQGCFQSDGNNRFHFNTGKGGSYQGSDKILCTLKDEDEPAADCHWEKTANSFFQYIARGSVSTSTAKECKAVCEAVEWCKLIEFSRFRFGSNKCGLYDLHTKDGDERIVPNEMYDLYELYCPNRDREAKTVYPTLDDEDLDDEEEEDEPAADCHWEKNANSFFQYIRREAVKTSTAKECKALCEAREWCKLIEFSRFRFSRNNCALYDTHAGDSGAVVPNENYDLYELYCPFPRESETKWDALLEKIKTFSPEQLQAFGPLVDKRIQPVVEKLEWLGDELFTPLKQRDWAEVAEATDDPMWDQFIPDWDKPFFHEVDGETVPIDDEDWAELDEKADAFSAMHKWFRDEVQNPVAERDWEKMINAFNEDPYNLLDEESDESPQLGRGMESPRLGNGPFGDARTAW